jgi:hypothetical protein
MDPALESSAVKYIDFGSLASWFQDIRQLPDRQTAVPRAREGVDKPEFPLPQSRQTFWSRPVLHSLFGFFVEFNL